MRPSRHFDICAEIQLGHQKREARLLARIAELETWLPMETAPKDGTEILLLVPHRLRADRLLRLTGRWFDRFWITFNADEAIQRVEPTRWMRLPDAPRA